MPFSTSRIALAIEVRERAYAPYSGYKVGAAVEASSGNVYVGCNVENISYGATTCAERNAISAMVAAGETSLSKVTVATEDGGLPCGICLQTIAEFGGDVEIEIVSGDKLLRVVRLADLLPEGFRSANVNRT